MPITSYYPPIYARFNKLLLFLLLFVVAVAVVVRVFGFDIDLIDHSIGRVWVPRAIGSVHLQTLGPFNFASQFQRACQCSPLQDLLLLNIKRREFSL